MDEITVTGDLSGTTVITERDAALLAVLKEIAREIANPHPFPYLKAALDYPSALEKAITDFERIVNVPLEAQP